MCVMAVDEVSDYRWHSILGHDWIEQGELAGRRIGELERHHMYLVTTTWTWHLGRGHVGLYFMTCLYRCMYKHSIVVTYHAPLA